MSLSDELRDELAAIAPARRCCRLAELSALFHCRRRLAPARARRARGPSRPRRAAAAARRAFALLRDLGVRSEIRTYRRQRVRPGDALPAPRRGRRARGRRCSARPASSRRRGAPLERPPKRVVGRSCCRGAYLRGALLGAGSLSGPRAPHLELRATGARRRALPRRRRRARRRAAHGRSSAARHAVAYAKGGETIADLLALAGASETALRLDEHAVVAATRAEANRLANADEANVKRTVERRPAPSSQAIEQLDLDALPRSSQEIADAAAPAPVALARRARGEVPAADHEGRRPSPHGALAECGSSGIDQTASSRSAKCSSEARGHPR